MVIKKFKTRIFGNKRNGQLSITLPKKKFKKVKPGDIVRITLEDDIFRGGKKNGINKTKKRNL